jgi:hypothetical protein
MDSPRDLEGTLWQKTGDALPGCKRADYQRLCELACMVEEGVRSMDGLCPAI